MIYCRFINPYRFKKPYFTLLTLDTINCPDASTNQPDDDTAPLEDTVPDDRTEVQRGMEAGRVTDDRRTERGGCTMESRGSAAMTRMGYAPSMVQGPSGSTNQARRPPP